MVLNMPGIAGPVAWNGFARIVDIIFIDSECWLRVSLGVAHSVIRLFSHSKSAICQKITDSGKILAGNLKDQWKFSSWALDGFINFNSDSLDKGDSRNNAH